MQEDFLHYIWQYQKLKSNKLETIDGERIQVISVGQRNVNSGPDFFNSRLVIGDQEWAGNVEIHIKTSDWYIHNHEIDENYDNVILHVVWEDDVVVFDAYDNPVKTLVLKNNVDEKIIENYKKLLSNKLWINCESDIHTVNSVLLMSLKDSFLVARLERKSKIIQNDLNKTQNNWEEVLFKQLAKSFGLTANTHFFEQLVNSISYSVFKKEITSRLSLEALLFGQANMLDDDLNDSYYEQLKNEYLFLKRKYNLMPVVGKVQFFRMRPANFPTIRLSQFATLYSLNKNMFSRLIENESVQEIKQVFKVKASSYWDTHYVFGKISNKKNLLLSEAFVERLIINVFLPLKYLYYKTLGKTNFDVVFDLYKSIQPETNGVIAKFKQLNIKVDHAGDSQALLELKKYYCDNNKCLNCKIGNKLLYL
ncbi:DUF2851 family protein [Pseudofulvibacter geojedonensis]|uniref:DUF2851 family protein n=1 Tax=Pseudofulvibacter geojedonensis TaxID=1123758 RepID=A0ABW3I0K1_9FLAO